MNSATIPMDCASVQNIRPAISLPIGGDGPEGVASFDNRDHFFAAVAEAKRRILVDNARRKKRHFAQHGRSLLGLARAWLRREIGGGNDASS